MNGLHVDPELLRYLALVLLILLIFSSRVTKGSARKTAEGLSFGIKPLFSLMRGLLLLAYTGFVVYLMASRPGDVRWWIPVLLAIVIAFAVIRLPGTIVLGQRSLVQRFWLLKDKEIAYRDVKSVQAAQAGRATRVMGNNRVMILHSGNHAAMDEFRNELRNRTGKSPVL